MRHLMIKAVGCLAVLEKDIRILGGAALVGVLGVHSTFAELVNCLMIHHFGHQLVRNGFDFLNLMRGAEAVKKVQKWQTGLDSCQMRHRP